MLARAKKYANIEEAMVAQKETTSSQAKKKKKRRGEEPSDGGQWCRHPDPAYPIERPIWKRLLFCVAVVRSRLAPFSNRDFTMSIKRNS